MSIAIFVLIPAAISYLNLAIFNVYREREVASFA